MCYVLGPACDLWATDTAIAAADQRCEFVDLVGRWAFRAYLEVKLLRSVLMAQVVSIYIGGTHHTSSGLTALQEPGNLLPLA